MIKTHIKLLLLLFCGLANVARAQQEFTLNGVVLDKAAKLRIALAEISNKRNRYSVGSNDMGLFQIKAAIGDTLLINKRGFNEMAVVVASTRDVVVSLTKSENMLNEVVVYGATKKQTMDDIKRDFKNKGAFYGGKPSFLSFLFTPLTAVYELFGRTPRNARRFDRYYQTEMEQSQVDVFFNKALINEHTGLEGKQLEDFMLNYRPDYQKARNWTTYDGIKWIRDSYKKYTDTLKMPLKPQP